MKKILIAILLATSSSAFASFSVSLPNLSDLDQIHKNAEKAVANYAKQTYGLDDQDFVIGYMKKKNSILGKIIFVVIEFESQCSFQADARVNFKKGNWTVVEIPNTNTCL